ncbi:MAG: hypothetical protein KC800_24305 [Candidatus Eremiobacteraeota bacterium]|nr:hypothetical protein [Candidatus Eremiobacteraeota bacterium]
MIAMGLVFLVLGLMSVLMREYSDMTRHAAARDNTMDAVQYALRQMRNEVGGAAKILNPAFQPAMPPGGTANLGDNLSFLKFRSADRDARFPPFNALPADYDPWSEEYLSAVSYQQFEKSLTRTAGSSPPQTVVPEINSFNVTQVGPRYLQLTLSFQEVRRHRHYSLDAKLWVKQL